MKRKYRGYSDKDIIEIAAKVTSMAQLLRTLGLRVAGGNYTSMKLKLQKLNLDCDHWHGQAWSKNERLKDWSKYTRAATLKPHLIKERGNTCERCCLSKWLDKPISLEIHHKDGNKTNNCELNLELLCPNCHSFTDTYKGKNIKYDKPYNRKYVGNGQTKTKNKRKKVQIPINRLKKLILQYSAPKVGSMFGVSGSVIRKICKENNINIIHEGKFRKFDPTKEELKIDIDTMNFCAIGRKYDVSDNAIRKRAKKMGLL